MEHKPHNLQTPCRAKYQLKSRCWNKKTLIVCEVNALQPHTETCRCVSPHWGLELGAPGQAIHDSSRSATAGNRARWGSHITEKQRTNVPRKLETTFQPASRPITATEGPRNRGGPHTTLSPPTTIHSPPPPERTTPI